LLRSELPSRRRAGTYGALPRPLPRGVLDTHQPVHLAAQPVGEQRGPSAAGTTQGRTRHGIQFHRTRGTPQRVPRGGAATPFRTSPTEPDPVVGTQNGP